MKDACMLRLQGFSQISSSHGLATFCENFTRENLPHVHNELRYVDTRENFTP